MNNTAKSPSIIAFLSDFGLTDPYAGIVKGVIASIAPDTRIIDITHAIPPQDITAGALMLAGSYRYFPGRTVFLSVVDPGVGSSRRGIVARLPDNRSGNIFVLPDNGLITGVIRDLAKPDQLECYYIENRNLYLNDISSTFHARDIFAPVAAHITAGIALEEIGPPCDAPIILEWPEPDYVDNVIRGKIIYIDGFGNLITNIRANSSNSLKSGAATARIAGHDIPVLNTYSDAEPGGLLCLEGSFGLMEIAANKASAEDILGVQTGANVEIWTV